MISPDLLVEEGLLSKKDLHPIPAFPQSRCDFSKAIRYKNKLLEKAYQKFIHQGKKHPPFNTFCRKNSLWLEDFSLFMALKKNFKGKPWNQWPDEFRDRNPKKINAFKREGQAQIEKEKIFQYLFFHQWQLLKDYCRGINIRLIGDLPIYVSIDSADAWVNPDLFKLDQEKTPAFVSGVPPDYFSKSGQMWNHPVYNWKVHQTSKYHWWIERIAHNLKLCDVLRIDHFRGLVAYWEIPAGAKTAIAGKWVKSPANDFLFMLKKRFSPLPIIAEDLGFITPDVRKVMERFQIPGMKILQFAFTEDCLELSFRPHAYEKNCWVYIGTHDNNTIRGWFEDDATASDRKSLFRYLGRKVSVGQIHWALICLSMMSVAGLAIFPMQDVLGLGSRARMNNPSIAYGNWEWRMAPGKITPLVSEKLLDITETYGRSCR